MTKREERVRFEELKDELIVHIDVRNLSSLASDCLKEEILSSYEIIARLDHALK